jgi:hypothetical protein
VDFTAQKRARGQHDPLCTKNQPHLRDSAGNTAMLNNKVVYRLLENGKIGL